MRDVESYESRGQVLQSHIAARGGAHAIVLNVATTVRGEPYREGLGAPGRLSTCSNLGFLLETSSEVFKKGLPAWGQTGVRTR